MKRFLIFIALFFSVCVNAQLSEDQLNKIVGPKPSVAEGLVIDRTNTFTPEQKQALNQKLIQYDDSTSNQIAVVMISSLQDYAIEDVSLGILRSWGVGSKKNNNGVVLLIAKDDRKMRIEVGYGLEGAITDVTASHIIDNDLAPNFKQEDYYRGIDIATDHLIKAAAGEYTAPEGYNKRGKKFPFGVILFVIIIIISLFSRGGGGRNGGMISRRGFGGFWTGMILGNMLGGGGKGEWGSGGGWSGGGGGGFGGFGGGSGGGGGASGGW